MVAIGIWGWSHVRMAVFQTWGNRVLDRRIDCRQHLARRLPNRKATDGVPVEADIDQCCGVLGAQVELDAPLDDPEEQLVGP